MPALRGKDYGKTKMRYPDYKETDSGLQFKVVVGKCSLFIHIHNFHSFIVSSNNPSQKIAGLASRRWPHSKSWRHCSGKPPFLSIQNHSFYYFMIMKRVFSFIVILPTFDRQLLVWLKFELSQPRKALVRDNPICYASLSLKL